jgi:hypothetical protein
LPGLTLHPGPGGTQLLVAVALGVAVPVGLAGVDVGVETGGGTIVLADGRTGCSDEDSAASVAAAEEPGSVVAVGIDVEVAGATGVSVGGGGVSVAVSVGGMDVGAEVGASGMAVGVALAPLKVGHAWKMAVGWIINGVAVGVAPGVSSARACPPPASNEKRSKPSASRAGEICQAQR